MQAIGIVYVSKHDGAQIYEVKLCTVSKYNVVRNEQEVVSQEAEAILEDIRPSPVQTLSKQVWDAIKQTYLDGADEAKIYDLHRRSFIMRQAGASVAKYYSELIEIFQELDQLNPSTMEHPSDIEIRRKEVNRLRVYIFLAGLNNNFDQIRGEILRMEPKPELEVAYAHIKRESNRQGTMYEAGATNAATALAAARVKQSRLHSYNVDPTRNRPPMNGTTDSKALATSGGVSEHPLQGESSIFAEDTHIQIQQKVLEQSVFEQPVTMVQQGQELLRTLDAGTEQSDSEQPVIVVQQDQESLRTPDAGTSSDNFPSTTPTTVPSPYIQSGPDNFPQFYKHAFPEVKLDKVFSTKRWRQGFRRESIPLQISQLIRKIFEASRRKVHFIFLGVMTTIEIEKSKTIHHCEGIRFQVYVSR
ncbi:hypothetical protein POTOM_061640 [Populus tomentosa]|uniref:Retrotransposon gag domain-containing protein n=1 Tax=Populus tomentosa TaxID=118781 RepID=A0A8X8C034_POPTO|nr:hypothetical protein POTOM_061640 [Populus tomentosa]